MALVTIVSPNALSRENTEIADAVVKLEASLNDILP